MFDKQNLTKMLSRQSLSLNGFFIYIYIWIESSPSILAGLIQPTPLCQFPSLETKLVNVINQLFMLATVTR
jgi:hypothetical protein